jgi:hypothetical protein
MQLMAQDYAEVVAALKAANDTKGHERRTTARLEVQAQVKIFPYRDGQLGPAYTCLTRDLSFKGVGLFQARQSARGSQFVVVLPKIEGKPLSLLCNVMFCRPLADGLYNVGAAFESPYDFYAPAGGNGKANGVPAPAEDELTRIRQSILG